MEIHLKHRCGVFFPSFGALLRPEAFPEKECSFLLWEWINHEARARIWVRFLSNDLLNLGWHEDGSLKRLHHGDIDCDFVFIVFLGLGSCEVVPYREYFSHLLLPVVLRGVLSNQPKLCA